MGNGQPITSTSSPPHEASLDNTTRRNSLLRARRTEPVPHNFMKSLLRATTNKKQVVIHEDDEIASHRSSSMVGSLFKRGSAGSFKKTSSDRDGGEEDSESITSASKKSSSVGALFKRGVGSFKKASSDEPGAIAEEDSDSVAEKKTSMAGTMFKRGVGSFKKASSSEEQRAIPEDDSESVASASKKSSLGGFVKKALGGGSFKLGKAKESEDVEEEVSLYPAIVNEGVSAEELNAERENAKRLQQELDAERRVNEDLQDTMKNLQDDVEAERLSFQNTLISMAGDTSGASAVQLLKDTQATSEVYRAKFEKVELDRKEAERCADEQRSLAQKFMAESAMLQSRVKGLEVAAIKAAAAAAVIPASARKTSNLGVSTQEVDKMKIQISQAEQATIETKKRSDQVQARLSEVESENLKLKNTIDMETNKLKLRLVEKETELSSLALDAEREVSRLESELRVSRISSMESQTKVQELSLQLARSLSAEATMMPVEIVSRSSSYSSYTSNPPPRSPQRTNSSRLKPAPTQPMIIGSENAAVNALPRVTSMQRDEQLKRATAAARELLRQRKITKSEFDVVCRAAQEASLVWSQ